MRDFACFYCDECGCLNDAGADTCKRCHAPLEVMFVDETEPAK